MERRKKTERRAELILTGDWHLREDQPVARVDDFWTAQWSKIEFICDMARRLNIPIIQSGDIFHHWKPSPYLLSVTIKALEGVEVYAVYGNHDLPQHSLEMAEKSGMYTLAWAGAIQLLSGGNWGQELEPDNGIYFQLTGKRAVAWHVMTWLGELPWPGCADSPADRLLAKNPGFDLIVTGHNHKTFVVERDGRKLVNPGSITRQTADQDEHEPVVFIWYDDGTLERIPLPAAPGVITREHIERKEHRDDRIDAFVSRLDGDWQAGVSFKENLERFMEVNTIRQSVRDIVEKSLDPV